MGLDYSFPVNSTRIRATDHPEILLVVVIVFSTQYHFPFEDTELPSQESNSFRIPRLDWDKWEDIMSPVIEEAQPAQGIDYRQATASDITSMTPEELDKYFTHMSLQIENQGKSSWHSELLNDGV